ncbi:MAG: GNAT family N-acetyltransferase [Thermomicrobiales bacterium]
MYGERGRLGLITLATDTSVLPEFQRLMPAGVQVYPAPIVLPRGEVTAAALAEMLEGNQLEEAAALLVWSGVQVILFACTTGSLVHGSGWDATLSERINVATGIPATTTTSAVLGALREVEAQRLVIATPYIASLNAIERDFFESSGFEVLAIDGLSCATDPEIGQLGPEDAVRLVGTLHDPRADAIFISCTNWHVVEAVSGLELRYGIPVITSNLAGAWQALQLIGASEPLESLVQRAAAPGDVRTPYSETWHCSSVARCPTNRSAESGVRIMTERSASPRSAGQTFLVGESIYFRPLEPDDAPTAAVWRKRPFPAPADVVEEQIRESLEVDDPDILHERMTMLVCRRDNDQPVGSVEVITEGWYFGEILPSIDPLASDAEQGAVIAECLGILIPWMLDERHQLTVTVVDTGLKPAVEAEVRRLGGRIAVRHREACLVEGTRVENVHYQFFNPRWIVRLGQPATPVFGSVDRDIASPARPRVTATFDDRPEDAIVLGERLYLRAFKPEEGALVARWALEETETYYPEGRLVFSPHGYGHFHKTLAKKEPPEWIRFAIVLRETGEMIGCNGLSEISWVHARGETETEIFQAKHRSAGYGTEAKHLLLEYAFDRIGLHMVYSHVADINTRSSAALIKQGYREAGMIAWDTPCEDGFCAYLSYDLLAEEWRAARDGATSR